MLYRVLNNLKVRCFSNFLFARSTGAFWLTKLFNNYSTPSILQQNFTTNQLSFHLRVHPYDKMDFQESWDTTSSFMECIIKVSKFDIYWQGNVWTNCILVRSFQKTRKLRLLISFSNTIIKIYCVDLWCNFKLSYDY